MQRVHKTVETKSRKYCSVPQCSSYCTGSVSLHQFPLRDTKLCATWRNVLKIGKPITTYMYVCSKHFIAEDFKYPKAAISKGERKPPKLLKKTAIPSVNIPQSSHMTIRKERRKLIKHENVDIILTENGEDSESQMDQNMEMIESVEPNQIGAMENQQEHNSNDNDMELEAIEIQPVMIETSVQTTEILYQLPQILDNDEKLKSFTGVDSTILGAYKKCMENVAAANDMSLSNIEFSIIMVLCKLKTNLSFSCLALFFGVSISTCTRMFYSTVNQLAVSIKSAIYWPTKEEILENMPKCFDKFKNTRIVLDCTEVRVQKLKCLNCRILSYSHYKRSHTMKFLIGITPSGLISYVSPAYGGRATDKAIFNRENLIAKCEPNDGIMVDKGVLIDTECEENFVKLIRPPFLRKKKQLTEADAKLTADIARARVHVERAIGRIKNFAILNDQIDWYLIPYIDDIMTIIAATVNMKTPILADDKFHKVQV